MRALDEPLMPRIAETSYFVGGMRREIRPQSCHEGNDVALLSRSGLCEQRLKLGPSRAHTHIASGGELAELLPGTEREGQIRLRCGQSKAPRQEMRHVRRRNMVANENENASIAAAR